MNARAKIRRGSFAARLVVASAFGASAYATVAQAQDVPPTAWARAYEANGALSNTSAAWLGAWSPLRPISEGARSLLRAPLAPGLLDAPPALVGAFILAGAPGSIARDFTRMGDTARFGELRVRTAGEKGDYRRPLDVAAPQVTQVSAQGWSRVGAHGVAIGRFVIDRETDDVSSFSPRITPYVSSRFVMTDSVQPPMQRTRARLEGALGYELGGFGLGLSAGIESREHLSVDFPLRRTGRASTPALSIGAERVLPWYGLRVGAYYRWSEPNESNILGATPLATRMYAVVGYDEPFGVKVDATTGSVFTRNNRHATAFGGTVEFTLLDARVVLTHEGANRTDNQTLAPFVSSAPTDSWIATGSETRLEVQRLLGPRLRATLVGAMEKSSGAGRRTDLPGIAYRGSDSRSAFEGDLRATLGGGMSAALLGGVVMNEHTLDDYAAELSSKVKSASPFVAVEFARRFGGFAVAAGLSAAANTPLDSRVPATDSLGVNYQRVIAPDVAYQVAWGRAVAEWITVTGTVGGRKMIVALRSERAAPRSAAPLRMQPEGNRSVWSMAVGIRP